MDLRLEWEDAFEGDELDRGRWFPYYLPQWSSRELARARYRVGGGELRLLIEDGQPPWCPDLDGETRVSSLQTGVFAGPAGSRLGQHRFHPDAVVREEQQPLRLYTPSAGRVEVVLRASDDPAAMVAFWLIGYEDRPERSGELCVCEIFGRDVGAREAGVGVGVHPFGDPRLVDDFERVVVPIDAREPHLYAAEWTAAGAAFSVDGEVVKRTARAPDYPLQLMLGIYELPAGGGREGRRPKELVVEAVRGYAPADRTG